MRVLSVFSGISAASVAWKPLGFELVGFAERDPFACSVLHHRCGAGRPRHITTNNSSDRKALEALPLTGVPNLGDMTRISDDDLTALGHVDVLEAGSPCQDFSHAGARQGAKGGRGSLTLELCSLVARMRRINNLQYLIWENVSGIFSSNDNAFGQFLGQLVGADQPLEPETGRWTNAGYAAGPQANAAWRVFNSQFFGVPQRRRRVFVVASLGDRSADPRAILFEPGGLRGHPATGRTARKGTAGDASGSADDIHPVIALCDDYTPKAAVGQAYTLLAGSPSGGGHRQLVVHTAPIAFMAGQSAKSGSIAASNRVSPTLRASASGTNSVPSVAQQLALGGKPHLLATGDDEANVQDASDKDLQWVLRPFTPIECERLMGFPDGWTDVPFRRGTTKTHRYRALGNSMVVPCVAFIGKRLKTAEALSHRPDPAPPSKPLCSHR